ncbi:unnamed protein product [Didymodactylos carnosus]|uniref:Uncharacterized protein n=1 Tax=Didymodactylos carnosus TaxID=1234261 RepID=A0A8S2EGY3_9BILA|nr:unnamed protein product [Didymodactylos carnosus]CAF3988924.1 unnamed protein product [Didymodactylos carnosus]
MLSGGNTVLVDLVQSIYLEAEQSKVTKAVFLDFSKAFDRVWIKGLLKELEKYKHEYFPHYYRDCIQKTKYIPSKLSYNSKLFYFGGQRAFKRKIFIIFTSNFVTCHLTYNSYCDAHRATIKDSYPSTNPILDPKIFQHNHFIFELCRFVFMLTTSEFSEIQLDYLSDEHDRYFREKNSTLYSLFANRTVCNYDNVIDLSIPELGPILIGCYETPVRRNSGNADPLKCSFHQPSSLSLQRSLGVTDIKSKIKVVKWQKQLE